MNDNLIFNINTDQEIGQELANKLNGNYIVSSIEIKFDKIINTNDVIYGFCIEDFNIHLFQNNFYNNIMICNALPLVHIRWMYKTIPPITKNSKFFEMYIDHEEDDLDKYELKITFKPVLNKYYYSICSFRTSIQYQIYSDFFNDIKEFDKYINETTNIDIKNLYDLFKEYCEHDNTMLFIFKNLNSKDDNKILIGNLNDV